MKKLVVLMAAMGMMGTAFAGNVGTRMQPMPSLIPSNGQWTVGLTALYLRPTVSDGELAYGTSSTTSSSTFGPTEFTVTNDKSFVVDPHWHGGFIFNLGYQLPCDCNDISLSYLRMNTSNSESSGGFVGDSDGDGTNVPAVFTGHSKIDLDQIDLAFGHTTNLTSSIDMRLFAGLRYTNFNRTFSSTLQSTEVTTFDGLTIVDNNFGSDTVNDKFWGVGPLFGISGNYNLTSCFGFTAQFDTAFAIGRPSRNFTDSFVNVETISGVDDEGVPFASQSTSSDITNFHSGTSYAVVPVVDGKLGAYYRAPMGCNTQLLVEGGYRAMHYFNLIENHADLSYNGPYLGATVGF